MSAGAFFAGVGVGVGFTFLGIYLKKMAKKEENRNFEIEKFIQKNLPNNKYKQYKLKQIE